VKNSETKKPILQFVSIKRLDTNEWAIPGVRNFISSKVQVNLLLNIIVFFLQNKGYV